MTRILLFCGMIFYLAVLSGPRQLKAAEIQSLKLTCEACHGPRGASSNPLVPSIGGQAYTLLEDSLLGYRDDAETCKESEHLSSAAFALLSAMCVQVKQLNDEDISLLAEYFEAQPFVAVTQEYDAQMVSDGAEIHHQSKCEQCHSGGGQDSNGMAAVLAGQWSPYLRSAFLRIRAQQKKGPKVMNAAIQEFTDVELEALIHFYASQSDAAN